MVLARPHVEGAAERTACGIDAVDHAKNGVGMGCPLFEAHVVVPAGLANERSGDGRGV